MRPPWRQTRLQRCSGRGCRCLPPHEALESGEKVDMASIEELLESLEDQVQSVDMKTMNRL